MSKLSSSDHFNLPVGRQIEMKDYSFLTGLRNMIQRLFVITILSLLCLVGSPSTLAQNSAENALDNIKNELQRENIEVIDFSMEQGKWGSLSRGIVNLLVDEGFENLADLAKDYEEWFEGPDSLREKSYQLSLLEARKTQATSSEIEIGLISQIGTLESEIIEDEKSIAEQIGDNILNEEDVKKFLGTSDDFIWTLEAEKAGNAIFQEIKNYFSQGKWGNLSYPLAYALSQEKALWEGEEIKSIATLAKIYSSVEELKELLTTVEYENENGDIVSLNSNQIEQITLQVEASQFEGERQINQIILTAVTFIRNLIGSLAILLIVVSGIRMATSDDESVITEQKKALLYSVIGLMAILLIERAVALLYGTTGALRDTLAPSEGFDAEVYGIVNFLRAIVGVIAILFIVRAGFLSITAQGEEEKISQNRKSIVYVVIGLIVVAINEVIIRNIFIEPSRRQGGQIYDSNVAAVINTFGSVIQFFLGFVGLIALGALVYGGALLIMNYGGDEETITKAKNIIKNAIIGIIIIIAAYTIVSTLIVFR